MEFPCPPFSPRRFWQTPRTQVTPGSQAASHSPQCPGLLNTSVQVPSHNSSPSGHLQTPSSQFCPVGQEVSQSPQWWRSESRSTQLLSHAVFPSAQFVVQMPSEQTSWMQAFPHAPQLLPSPCTSTQMDPHRVRPPPQTHCPSWQIMPGVQALPHCPQFETLLERRKQASLQRTSPSPHEGRAPPVSSGSPPVPPDPFWLGLAAGESEHPRAASHPNSTSQSAPKRRIFTTLPHSPPRETPVAMHWQERSAGTPLP